MAPSGAPRHTQLDAGDADPVLMLQQLVGLLRATLDLVAPPACAACGAVVGRCRLFCDACAEAALPIRACGEDGVYAAYVYDGPVAVAIRRAKYPGDPVVASALGHAMRGLPAGDELGADLVVPVPLTRERLAERGFNQAAPLARAVARETGARFAPTAMRRLSSARSQASQNAAGRRALVEACPFVATARVRGAAVLVCDDVVTTGSTLAACAVALRRAGASRVVGVALARVPAPGGRARGPS